MLRHILAAAILACAGPALAADYAWPPSLGLSPGDPVDEAYRGEFDACDATNSFHGQSFTGWQGCRGDPNKAAALRRLPGGVIAYVSKLAVDLDGSPFACSADHGETDQCPTSLMLDDGTGARVPVDADRVPYVVIPAAGPGERRGEFSRLTGVRVGDFGVVVKDGATVPVIVADTGPYNKLGEGSLALHRALGRELCTTRDEGGTCRAVVRHMTSIDDGVVTILFPGSARHDLTPAILEAAVRTEGASLWAAYQRAHPATATATATGQGVAR